MSRALSLRRIASGLWIALLPLFVVMLLWPVNTRSLRIGILIAASGIILGSLIFAWKRRTVFFVLVGLYFTIGFFLLLPGHPPENIAEFQRPYIEAMAAYEGVQYVWGGENRLGMDCSGLVRKGFETAILKKGILSLNPFLVRGAIDLWRNDTTASEIGRGYDGRLRKISSGSTNLCYKARLPSFKPFCRFS